MFTSMSVFTDIKNHSYKNDETKPLVKCADEKYDSYGNVNNGRQNLKKNVIKQIIDRVCAAIHDS